MQFDNPMITFEPEPVEHEGLESVDLDTETDTQQPLSWAQIRQEIIDTINLRSFVHGTYYAVLIFGIVLFFLEVGFGILDDDRINGMMALILVLGVASTVVKSRMDDRELDPNHIASPSWRYILFIFVAIELALLTLIRDKLINSLPDIIPALYAGLVITVTVFVLWQFTQEEFEDYLEAKPDRMTVAFHYAIMTLLSGSLFILPQIPLPEVEIVASIVSVILFLFYGGLFWTYAFYDRMTINIVSRMTLSVMISLLLLPLVLVLLEQLTVPITSITIIGVNFVLCTLGLLMYYARPRLQNLLTME